MATIASQSGTLAWLRALLLEQRGALKNLLARMSFLGTPGSMTPSVFANFLQMLKQVVAEKEHEKDIISQIEDIEYRHRARRKTRQLKTAAPARNPAIQNGVSESEPEAVLNAGWMAALAAVYLLILRKPKPQQ